jgi:hypothetical protein
MAKKNPGKKLDKLAAQLGDTIKSMTPEQKRQYAEKVLLLTLGRG